MASSCSNQSPRNQRLAELAAMVVDGEHTYKLDHIATIHIGERFYFTVFRRYNSPYNIVVEDYNDDFYLFQNETVRCTLANILCLSEGEDAQLSTRMLFSFKHNGPAMSITSRDPLDMTWLELQERFEAANMNLYPFGTYADWRDDVCDGAYDQEVMYYDEDTKDDTPSTPREQMMEEQTEPPGAPARPPYDDYRNAQLLLTISIPQVTEAELQRECDGEPLSLRNQDVQSRKRKREPVCYCDFHSEEEEEGEDDETVDTANYTILRNGTMIPKPL
jgi:hypothetical protein